MVKKLIEVDTKFYTFSQNNSGGRFRENSNITHYVIIEATSKKDAISRAEEIGLYFDGEGDCSCCGSRWSTYVEGEDIPMIYSSSVLDEDFAEKESAKGYFSLIKETWDLKYLCIIHYIDGSIFRILSNGKREE